MAGGQEALVPTAGKGVLVVDDEPDIREAIRDLLVASLDRARVHVAASAFEARAILDRHTIDLILTDYRMPGQNGLDFLESLDPAGRAARVLLTAYPEVEVAERAVGPARVAAFLTKPAEPAHLLDVVERILAGEWSADVRDAHHDRVLRSLREQSGA